MIFSAMIAGFALSSLKMLTNYDVITALHVVLYTKIRVTFSPKTFAKSASVVAVYHLL